MNVKTYIKASLAMEELVFQESAAVSFDDLTTSLMVSRQFDHNPATAYEVPVSFSSDGIPYLDRTDLEEVIKKLKQGN